MLVFNFDDLSTKDKAAKKAVKHFKEAGLVVVSTDVSPSAKRTNGISYREMYLTFADSQVATMRIKQTGDIYQVLINGKVVPIKNQNDHKKGIEEIADFLVKSRTAFQKKLAAMKVDVPKSIRTAVPKMEETLTKKRDALVEANAMLTEEINKLRAVNE